MRKTCTQRKYEELKRLVADFITKFNEEYAGDNLSLNVGHGLNFANQSDETVYFGNIPFDTTKLQNLLEE